MRLFVREQVQRILQAVAIGAGLAGPLAAQCGEPVADPPLRAHLLVSPAQLAARLNQRELVVIQLGDRNAYAIGHIPGARLLEAHALTVGDHDLPPVPVIDSLLEGLGVGDGSQLVIYGEPGMLGWLYVVLDVMGLGDRTAVLDGGMQRWLAEGRPVTRTPPPSPARAVLTPRPRSGVIVDATQVQARLRERSARLLDTRSLEEYTGAGRGDGLPRAGHLPGARRLEWSATFSDPAAADRGTPTPLKSPAELRALLRGVDLALGDTPVVYCTVGMRASHVYFVLRYLGYDPQLYDGSMRDWTRRADRPLITGDRP